IPPFTQFDSSLHGVQFEEIAPWIETYRINYHLGVDGISVLFILLNSFTTVLVVIAGWVVIEKKPAQYFAAFLIMSGIMNGVFAALDVMLFYVYLESMLITMYLIIGICVGPSRACAAVHS